MRIGINLASEPLRRDRPILLASAAVAFLMVVSLGILVSLALMDRKATARDRALQARLNTDLAKLKNEQKKVDAEVRRPENTEVLERSVLINELLLRKGISWTRIFSDLEETLPPNVRVTQIRPQVNSSNQIYLEMTIAADTPDPLVTFVSNLEQSNVFGSANVTVSQSPTQTDPFYRYRLSVNYAQKF
jgi:Tfp pilus assembly protein PilN